MCYIKCNLMHFSCDSVIIVYIFGIVIVLYTVKIICYKITQNEHTFSDSLFLCLFANIMIMDFDKWTNAKFFPSPQLAQLLFILKKTMKFMQYTHTLLKL